MLTANAAMARTGSLRESWGVLHTVRSGSDSSSRIRFGRRILLMGRHRRANQPVVPGALPAERDVAL